MRRVGSLYKLSALKVDKLKQPGTYEDGGGLRLVINAKCRKRWVLRITVAGRRTDVGLGGYPAVSLEDARTEAETHRKTVREGGNPVQKKRIAKGRKLTFKQEFDALFAVKKRTLTNDKHIAQWQSTMDTYVMPKIGKRSVADVSPSEIVDVLKPIWWDKAETASRVLQRIKIVFDAAIVLEHREKANPCTGVAMLLGAQHKTVKHHDALHYGEVSKFIMRLRRGNCGALTKLAFEWLILNANRSGETRLALKSEVDRATSLWTIPKERMKGRKVQREEHIVPLSPRALQIYEEACRLDPGSKFLFPAASGKPLSDMTFTKILRDYDIAATPHGFRTSFKTWCAEIDKVRDEVSEAALAHKDKDQVRAAYRRTTYVAERQGLMTRWAEFVTAPPKQLWPTEKTIVRILPFRAKAVNSFPSLQE